MTEGWKVGRQAMIGSLIIAHIWGTMLIVAVLRGRDSLVIGGMFEAVGFMIFSTLAVLVGGKAWKDFAPMKWGNNDVSSQILETNIVNRDGSVESKRVVSKGPSGSSENLPNETS